MADDVEETFCLIIIGSKLNKKSTIQKQNCHNL